MDQEKRQDVEKLEPVDSHSDAVSNAGISHDEGENKVSYINHRTYGRRADLSTSSPLPSS